MVADFGPSFSLTPQAFTPTTWRLDGGASRSAACREEMRESVRFIAPTGRGGRAIPDRCLCYLCNLFGLWGVFITDFVVTLFTLFINGVKNSFFKIKNRLWNRGKFSNTFIFYCMTSVVLTVENTVFYII